MITSHFLPSNHLHLHIALSLISYSHRPLVLLETSPVDHDPHSILRGDVLTLLMVSRHSTKIFPSFYSNESARGEGQCADQCTNLNNLFPAARVSNTVSWGDYTALRSPVSFFFSGLPRLHGKKSISTCGLVAGTLSAPPLAYKLLASTGMNQMVGT